MSLSQKVVHFIHRQVTEALKRGSKAMGNCPATHQGGQVQSRGWNWLRRGEYRLSVVTGVIKRCPSGNEGGPVSLLMKVGQNTPRLPLGARKLDTESGTGACLDHQTQYVHRAQTSYVQCPECVPHG